MKDLVLVAWALAVAGCGGGSAAQQLRDAEARNAMAEARLNCEMATNTWNVTDPIVATCVKAVAPNLYRQAVQEDAAELNRLWIPAPEKPTPTWQPQPSFNANAEAPTPMPPPVETPIPDPNTMMSHMPTPAPPVRFIPYTAGGGNPSGYGLLAQ